MERSDIDIAVSGVDNFESLVEKVIIGGYQAIWTRNLTDGFYLSAIHWMDCRIKAIPIFRLTFSKMRNIITS